MTQPKAMPDVSLATAPDTPIRVHRSGSRRFVAQRPVISTAPAHGNPSLLVVCATDAGSTDADPVASSSRFPQEQEQEQAQAQAPVPAPVWATPWAPEIAPLAQRPIPGTVNFGVLAPFVSEPAVTDIFINGPGQLWVDRGTGPVQQPEFTQSESEVRELATNLIAAGGRHIDEATPCVDVRLLQGIRVHAVLPPISPGGTLVSIRLPRVVRLGVEQLERDGFFDAVPLRQVRELVRLRRNLLLTGAGGSGKTTFLAAMLSLAELTDRIVAIEDVAELQVDHPQFVSLEARQSNLEGAGEVGLQRLVREALRMRPDRLVLGECRGAEIRELLGALNTGHDGGAGTLHANSLADVPARLEALGALAGLNAAAIARQAVSAIDAILHIERVDGHRRLAQLGHLAIDTRDRLVIASGANGD